MASLRAGIDSDKSRHTITRLGHGKVTVWANTWGGRIEVTLFKSGNYGIAVTDFDGTTMHQHIVGSIPAPIRKRDGTLKPRTAPKPRTPRPKKAITAKAFPYVAGPATSLLSTLSTAIAERLPESGNPVDDDTLPLSDEDRALMEAVM